MKKAKLPVFKASDFTATQFYTAQEKADYTQALCGLVLGDFAESKFPKTLWRRLMHSFGHIAHFDRDGFYATWFSTNARRLDWITHVLDFQPYGDATHTYCDVERAFRAWLSESGMWAKYRAIVDAETEARERAALAALKAKYPDA